MEFFPEEGKYHMDGHRACQVRLEPEETRRHGGNCPVCGKPVTVGVMHRVETLADRSEPKPPEKAAPFRSLVPLPEIVSEICGVGPKSKTVGTQVSSLVARLGPELEILERLPVEDLRRHADPVLTEAIERLRRGEVVREGGYDGEYGTIRMFEPGELAARTAVPNLFGELLVPEPGLALARTVPLTPEPPPEASPSPKPRATSAGARLRRRRRRPSELPFDPPSPSPATVLDRLDPDQRAAAEIVEGPLLIIAGPGTGKTRTLTHRIAHLVSSGVTTADRCLAITFTRRAAEELRERLADLLETEIGDSEVPVHTFHSLGLEILRAERAELGLHRGFRIAEDSERLELARELFGLTPSQASRRLRAFSLARRERATGQVPELAEDLAAYETALWERDLVDFDDLLVLPVKLFTERPDLRAAYRHRFRWISIDEYQDVDALQVQLVRLLAPADANLCAIGDPDQSIYRFRGAEVGFFLRFQRDYPDARVVHLGRNYRSSRSIVGAAVSAIAPASLVAERQLHAVDDAAAEPVVIQETASERAEAELVVREIESLLGGTSYYSVDSGRVEGGGSELSFDDFAVLYRTDAQSGAVMEALDRAGIPFQKRSHTRLVDRLEVQTLVDALRCREVASTTDSVLERLRAEAERLAAQAEQTESDAAESSETEDPAVEEPPLDRAASLRRAVELVAPLAKRHGNDLAGFLAEIALGAEVDTWDPRAERISLLTLHAAKGLEFPVVFIVGCEEGLLPLLFGEDDEDENEIEEERRLFFVGITRARSRLFLSHARKRSWRGKLRERRPSRFLADLQEELLERRKIEAPRRPAERGPRQLSLL